MHLILVFVICASDSHLKRIYFFFIKVGLNRLVIYRKKSVRHRRQMQNSAVWRSKLNKEQPSAKYWPRSNSSQCLGCEVPKFKFSFFFPMIEVSDSFCVSFVLYSQICYKSDNMFCPIVVPTY